MNTVVRRAVTGAVASKITATEAIRVASNVVTTLDKLVKVKSLKKS